MSLSPGTRLGPYAVTAKIGEGGMGEVYRARDARLDREVAVKILPETLVADPEALLRFKREAKAVAALSHPNIVAIHDVGEASGLSYVVLELLEGETLRAALERGPLPLRKAIDYAEQLAHGLAAAHDRSIVHRDLKPENVFLTAVGQVKILDFGIAPMRPRPGTSETATADPTTQAGVVLGTVGYMSPEQVRGAATDHRTDLFSFGAVLYEMVTGRRAFQRGSSADVISAILTEDPPELSTVRPGVPPGVARILRRCLEKQRGERFQSAHDLAFALDDLKRDIDSWPRLAAGRPAPDERLKDPQPFRRRTVPPTPTLRGSQVTPTERLEMQCLFLVDGLTETAIAQQTAATSWSRAARPLQRACDADYARAVRIARKTLKASAIMCSPPQWRPRSNRLSRRSG